MHLEKIRIKTWTAFSALQNSRLIIIGGRAWNRLESHDNGLRPYLEHGRES